MAAALPFRLRGARWELLYDLRRHGADIHAFYERVCGAKGFGRGSRAFGAPHVIVIEDSWGYVFGGVVTPSGWQLSQRRYFGDGESFVFGFEPSFRTWAWTGANDFFALGDTG